MKNEWKTELYRATHNPWLWISLFIGMGITGCHFVFCVLPLNEYIYGPKVSYPLLTFGKWIGMDRVSVFASLYYFVVPILASIPFVGTLKEDIKTGYIRNIVIRVSKIKYFIAKFLVTFVIAGFVTVIPLLFNFVLTATVLPLLIPQAGTHLFPIYQLSMMGAFYYQHPFLYVMVYLFLDFVFLGLLATLGLLASYLCDRIFSVILAPFIVYLFLYSLPQITGWYTISPFDFLNPGQPIPADPFVILVEVAAMLVAGGIFLYVSNKKEIL